MSTAYSRRTEEELRVTTLELFFDLVFVFTVTQLTTVLVKNMSVGGLVEVVVLLYLIFRMYSGYVWMTNSVAPDTTVRRTFLMAGMTGFLLIALAIPDAYGDAGLIFGIGYLVVTLIHSGLFIVSGSHGRTSMIGLLPVNLGLAAMVLVGAFLQGAARLGVWITVVVLMYVAQLYRPRHSDTNLRPGHFVERHGLVVIVALGETVVAIGLGAAGYALDLYLIGAASLGLVLVYHLWWAHFGRSLDVVAERRLAEMSARERARAAVMAFGSAHVPILLGVVVIAAGVKKTMGHAADHLYLSGALALGGGVAIFLLGEIMFRSWLHLGSVRWRVVALVTALATVPIGLWMALAQLAALVLVLIVMLTVEDFEDRRAQAIG